MISYKNYRFTCVYTFFFVPLRLKGQTNIRTAPLGALRTVRTVRTVRTAPPGAIRTRNITHIMKKLFTLLLALVATTALWAEDFEVNGIYYNILTDKTNEVEVTYRGSNCYDYDEYSGSITIPSTVTYNGTTYSVTSIGGGAFYGCSGLTSITIPNSITSIGKSAFYDCSGLTFITIPNSVTSIGELAFFSCSGLTSITIPNGVTSIGDEAFYDCSGLTSVTLGSGVTSIGEYAFSGCSSLPVENNLRYADTYLVEAVDKTLSTYFIKEGTKWIGSSAFENCRSLTSITIPNSVTNIGEYAFYDCSGLTSITIPNSVTSIGFRVFYNCSGLTSITIPNSVTSIGNWAFYGCSGLTSITIPNSVTSIGYGAFYYCSGLTSVTIPNSVTNIGYAAFFNCSGLTSIESLAEVPPTLGTDAFYNVPKNIPVYVPCGKVAAYQSAKGWKAFANIQGPLAMYSIAVDVNDNKMGTAKVDENTICGAQISATANYGYHFVQWSDGNTDNPRTLELTQDTAFTAEFAINQYSITTTSSHAERGTTQGDTTVNYLEGITISATPNYGYHFTQWNDGNTDNPRTVQVTEDKTYTAQFDKNIYSITTYCDNQKGSVDAPNNAEYLDEITISATANHGYHFTQWSDGNTDNPRALVLTQDTTFTAEFAVSYSGQCGDDLYWDYDEDNKKISITGSGDMYNYTKPTQPWHLFQEQITEVTTSNTTTSIGTSAFEGCIRLGKVSLGYGMENIATNAFAECKRLYDIYVYATYPPFAEESSFANYNVYLYIPCENQRDYILDVVWGEFKFIECIGAEPENMGGDSVVINTGSTDVTIIWPTEENADTYSIVIKKDGKVVCTLTFNSEGQLLNIAFAPGREGNHPAQYAEATTNGYRFTVTGLEEGTDYTYTVTSKDAANKTISEHSGEFTTQSNISTDIFDSSHPITNCQKLLRNGQLIIIRDGVEYNAMGVEL